MLRRRRSLSDINPIKSCRDGKAPPASDLLLCFPSRAQLSLMPKPICSPARPPEPATCHHRRRHLRNSGHRGGGGKVIGHGSSLFWAKPKTYDSDISEPTSPKVTCAGQIKVRPRPGSCKNWQSIMEEIERIRNKGKQKSAWIGAFGVKKDVMQFLTCLRKIRFDFHCFGSFPTTGVLSDGEEYGDDDDDDEYKDDQEYYEENIRNLRLEEESWANDHESKAVISKWYMILQENQGKDFITQEESKGKMIRPCSVVDDDEDDDDDDDDSSALPPPNALLLMRCRSAPAKSWREEKEEEEKDDREDEEKEKEIEKKDRLAAVRCGREFTKLSAEIAKETWLRREDEDFFSRSRSWRR